MIEMNTHISTCERKAPRLAIVIPCYNEEDILPTTLATVLEFLAECQRMGAIADQSGIVCVDDCSRDATWSIIARQAREHQQVHGVKLARNVGHQNALLAGLSSVPADYDAIVSIDADLQDDLSAITDMLAAWRNGYDVVYGVRDCRETDTFFKRGTAGLFYKLMLCMGVNLVPNHADFRLMGRTALDALLEYEERNLFLRGLVPLVGFPSTNVYYARLARTAGESKYPLCRMLGLAVEGITSFSITPLRAIAVAGVAISGFSLLAIIYILIRKISGHTVLGWSSVVSAIFFMGGVQMLSLGILGEYIGKIYMETKRRPRFHIQTVIGMSS